MKKYLPFCVLVLFVACLNESKQIESLEEEVIAIHDEVMPKTIDINRAQRSLKKIAQDSTLSEGVVASIRRQVKKLTEADDAMSKWMVEYKAPSKNDAFEIAMDYLNKEKVRITEVKNLINSSLKEGQELLKELEQKEK